jgi:hypothetical protein
MLSTPKLLLVLVVALGLTVSAPTIAAASASEGNNYIQNTTAQQTGSINLQSANPANSTIVVQAAPGQTAPVFEALQANGFEMFSISPSGNVTTNGTIFDHGSLDAFGPIYASSGMETENTVAIQPHFPDTKALSVESPPPANVEVFEVNTKEDAIDLHAHVISGNPTGATTVAAESAAGSGASASLSPTSNDEHGIVTVITGTGTAVKNLVTVRFSSALLAAPSVTLTAGTAITAAAKQPYVTATTSSFTIATISKPKANTTYVYNYSASQ